MITPPNREIQIELNLGELVSVQMGIQANSVWLQCNELIMLNRVAASTELIIVLLNCAIINKLFE